MRSETRETRSAVLAATLTAASLIAFQVAAKATRDAFLLSTFGFTSFPAMMIATSVLSIGFAFAGAGALTAWGPARVIPSALAGSAALLLAEWGVSLWSGRVGAVLVYLHYGCLGGLLISGFWSFVSERFDPRTARRRVGSITAWAALGGVFGGLIAERVSRTLPVTSMLPILAAFHLIAALTVTRIGIGSDAGRVTAPRRAGEQPDRIARSGLQALSGSPYLRAIVALVILAALSEGFLDLTLKRRVASAFTDVGAQLRFFALFYLALSLLTLLVQALASRAVLNKLGPAGSVAILPAGVAAATVGALVAPGLLTIAFARGTEYVIASSIYRPGYEVLFTPVPAREKRGVKALADVGAVRIGDLISGGLALGVVFISMRHTPLVLTTLALVTSTAALVVALRLRAGYVRSLERALLSGMVRLEPSDVTDSVTQTTMLRIQAPGQPEPDRMDPATVLRSLMKGPVDEALANRAISLLASSDVARAAMEALRRAGPEAVDPLVARLLDPREEFTVRRRIPLVLAAIADPRAVDGLARGLGDHRFVVRYRCARGLSRLLDLDTSLRIAPEVAYAAVLREVEAGAGVWEGRRLIDELEEESASPVMDDVIRERANKSLEHVFTLLALVLPREPLRIAFRGLHAKDAHLRGTALEYLEMALPPEIRRPLWPYLEEKDNRRPRTARSVDEAMERLLQSNESMVIHLRELNRAREGKAEPPANPPGGGAGETQ